MSEAKRPDAVLAAEYALGLLEGEDLLAARACEGNDPAFAAEVAQWRDRLAPLADEISPRMPRAEVWQRIEAALAEDGGDGEVVALRRKLHRWQWIAGASAAAAVALAVFAFMPGAPPTAPDGNIANLPATTQSPLAANMPIDGTPLRLDLTYLPDTHSLLVTAVGLSADGVHDHEIWLVPDQGELISLGVVTPGIVRAHEVPEAAAQAIASGSRLLLTREPLGGKPADADAGPVVAEARFNSI